MRAARTSRRTTGRSAARIAALSIGFAGLAGARAGAQPPPVSPDDFIAAAAGADAYEVMAARVALTESRDPKVRSFAGAMIREHAAAGAALRNAAVRSGLKPPGTGVGADQTLLLAGLQGLRGEDFDRAYAHQQVLAHRQVLATMHAYAREGSDRNLRDFARADTPMIERHLRTAQDLRGSGAD